MDINVIKFSDEDKEYHVIKVLNPKNSKYNYIIYEDDSDTYASRYEIIDGQIKLFDIEDDDEWIYIHENMEDQNERN